MVSCIDFSTQVECVLSQTNDYNIKVIILFIALFYSLVGLYVSKYVQKEESYMNYWLFYILKVIPTIYVVFFPLLLLTLRHDISLEVFITILVGGYFIILALFTGMSIFHGGTSVWKLFGYDDWNDFNDQRRYRAGNKGREKR